MLKSRKQTEETKNQQTESKVFGYVAGKSPAEQEYPADLPKNN